MVKYWFGQTINFKTRKRKHFSQLNNGCHPNSHLQNSYNLYGKENFIFEIIEMVNNVNFLTSYEQSYVNYYKTLKAGVYNVGDCSQVPFRGKKHTPETIEKIKQKRKIQSLKGVSDETRKKISLAGKGRKVSNETKKLQSERAKGRLKSDTHKTNLSKARMSDEYKRNHYQFKQYQIDSSRTASKFDDLKIGMTVLALGCCGEAGETADMIKKHISHGHDLDLDKLKKELGDQLWYITQLGLLFNFDLADIAATNIDKLKARYPDGFSEEASKNRKD